MAQVRLNDGRTGRITRGLGGGDVQVELAGGKLVAVAKGNYVVLVGGAPPQQAHSALRVSPEHAIGGADEDAAAAPAPEAPAPDAPAADGS